MRAGPTLVAALALVLRAVTALAEATPYEERCAAIVAARDHESAAERLHQLFDLSWAHALDEYPELATSVGVPGENGRWTDRSLAAIARRQHELEAPAGVLASIDRARLAAADQLSYDLFRHDVDESLAGRRFPGEYLPITQLGGVQQDAPRTLAIAPAATAADYADLLARLAALPTLVEQTIVLMQQGIAAGVTPPRVILRDVPAQVESLLTGDPLASPLLGPFTRMPDSIDAKTRDRLRAQGVETFTTSVVPAFTALRRYLVETYLPAARESVGLGALPDGEAWYAFAARATTTTALTPKRIHEIGLAEVKRIRGEMDRAIAASGFRGSLADFTRFLRTDPRFFFTSAEDLLAGYRDIAKRADPALVKLFGTLPRLPYGVEAVPAYAEQSQPAAYYEPGSLVAGRAATFFANTSALATRPRWAMEPLTLHEAVPGHHLQIALAQELEDVPEFRRHGGYTAFVEGWGLYAEGLGGEMGFYRDPYARFGRLSFEMWRAVRLVVDTGIHALGWSREQALRYFQENTAKDEREAVVEVDRYIAWPGQALAYKVGELKLRELRAYAEKTLGGRFDVRAFHDEVLGAGALPLDVLDTRVRAWVRERATR